MDGFLLAIIIISAALILAQWFVFQRIRTYLFQHYEPIKKKNSLPGASPDRDFEYRRGTTHSRPRTVWSGHLR